MKVSIIIPIYNPGEKLLQCLQSVAQQDYQDIEVLLVNDGSQDDSERVCQKFVECDPRFVYIYQENAGVSMARNKGIVCATGEYICFIDSDDSVQPDYVSSMVNGVNKSDADIVVQGLTSYKNGIYIDKKVFPSTTFAVDQLSDQLFEELIYFCGPYCKLYRTDLIRAHQLAFPRELAYGEDFVFFTEYLAFCHNVTFLSNCSYNYTVSVEGSLSSKTLHPDTFWKNQKNRRAAYKKLRRLFGLEHDFYPTENKIKLIALRGLIATLKKSSWSDKKQGFFLQDVIQNQDFGFYTIVSQTWQDKLWLWLIRLNSVVSRYVLRALIR